MNKTQLNRTHNALNRIAYQKMEVFSLDYKRPKEKNPMVEAIKWAKRNTKAFTEMAISSLGSGSYGRVSAVMERTDAYKNSLSEIAKNKIAYDKARMNYQKTLDAEVDRVMDSLYLEKNPDAIKAIESFSKFKS